MLYGDTVYDIPSRIMDKYVKVKKIGEGSFGVAFLARTKDGGKQVVLKEINMTKMTKKESDEARKEVAVLAQLKHSNIVSYLESFELTGNLYIVMDFCDGGDLYSRINAQHGTLFPEEQILDWFVQMCLAVKHIHDRKILHRDIKSQNIFLTKHRIIKLGDFGIAKVLNSTVELARTCIGTPYYLSPEICEAKPYNNKSDIWSLGCVLYELTALKHAFEASCMKALVLNIVRGIYTPPSSKFSAELRNLIAVMFKKNPRDRPSVNTILKKPLLQTKIKNFLSELEIAEEFSHTVMHGMKIQKAIQSPQPRPLPPRPSSAANKQPQSPYLPRYNPAAVYGPSVACRQSRENLCKDNKKSSEVKKSVGQDRPNGRRPVSSGNSRPPSAGPIVQDPVKRRQEFNEKENERRKEIQKKQDLELNRQHRMLIEKQKQARMNRNREDGWRNILNFSNSEEKEAGGAGVNVSVVREIGNYNNQVPQIRKLEERLNEPSSVFPPNQPKLVEMNPSRVDNLCLHAGNAGGIVGDRARIYNEFIQRKEAAALNRARVQGGIHLSLNGPCPVKPVLAVAPSPTPVPFPAKPAWVMAPSHSPLPGPSGDQVAPQNVDYEKMKEEMAPGVKAAWAAPGTPMPASDRRSDRPSVAKAWEDEKKKQEEDYMAKLRQIRLQNFNERCLKEKNAAQIHSPINAIPNQELNNNEERKKKIEALKAQADARAKKFKEDLEKQRMKLQEDKLKPPDPQAVVQPVVAFLNKIEPNRPSSGLTAAMVAIGVAQQGRGEPTDTKDQVKKTKQEILKRVNQSFSEAEPNESTRGKWPNAGITNILKQMEMEEPGKWKNTGVINVLGQMELEDHRTYAKEMEADKSGNKDSEEVQENITEEGDAKCSASHRKQWPTQRGTVVNILSKATISEAAHSATSAIRSLKKSVSLAEQLEVLSSEASVVVPNAAATTEPLHSNNETKKLETQVDGVTAEDVTEKDKQQEPLRTNEKARELEEDGICGKDDDDSNPADLKVEDLCPAAAEEEEDENYKEDQLEVDDLKEPEQFREDRLFLPGQGISVKQSLTTGQFDAADVQLLRTCSEPDLHKLTLTSQRLDEHDKMKKPPVKSSGDIRQDDRDEETAGNHEMVNAVVKLAEEESSDKFSIADLTTEDPELSFVCENTEEKTTESLMVQSADDDDDDDAVFNSDDSDLRTMRESMANILASNCDDNVSDEELYVAKAPKVKKKPKKGKYSKKGKKKRVKESSTEPASSLAQVWSDTSFDDFQSMKETMKSLLQPAKPLSSAAFKPKSLLALSAITETSFIDDSRDSRDADSLAVLNPGNDYDSDLERADDDYFEDDGIFARLEGMRASIEDQLGCEKFLKAYSTVLAFQEEDQDMEEGIRMVTRILGPDNVYLYPSILQLVMADASFADNG